MASNKPNSTTEFNKHTSLLDLFKASKNNIMVSLNVGTLGRVINITTPFNAFNGYGIVSYSPFPLFKGQESAVAYAYFFDNYDFHSNDLICVLCLDLDFRSDLKNKQTKQISTNRYHKRDFGVIIPIKEYTKKE